MPDPSTSTSGGKSKSLPNFYSAVGGMDKYSGGGAGAKPPAASAADSGEKIKNVTTLLEVVKKMDALESDPENKKLLEQVAGLVEQYMTKLQPGAGGGAAGKPGAAGSAGGGGADAGAAGGGAGAGATMGDTTGAAAAM